MYSCTAGGNMIKTQWTTDGSGSTYIWGFMDDGFKVGTDRQCSPHAHTHFEPALSLE